ncbi:alpha/beta fold hydrolase [Mycolicibacterium bacteremicum]|uniref:Alpha/beta hydrolase n=1 Tax=Mycolicibacterium bacteremicum TaxID=564198 RepID=A0A1W9YR64_MYCBA|nr:alpha/beta hydrolase [Mycolicibacterium bacteremicum]MCV7430080.1 alpha/beta hydrolase [Mycolicibacterium bacteremicum]ORA02581.1 alpha/beta hydrolase [Mycolicibacterium bacteremicum]
MPFVTTEDGARIFYKDWGAGESPVLLSHGWPVNADSWETTALLLAEGGHRVIAHDRRGYGRSTQTWHGNEMDSYADDLATLIDALDLSAVTLVGHSIGGAEVVRYIGRHGTGRVARLVLVSTGPLADTDALRARHTADRSQFYRELAGGPIFGHAVSQGIRDAYWLQAMSGGHRGTTAGITAFSTIGFGRDLARVDVPTLIIHGGADELVPPDTGGRRTAEIVDTAVLKIYDGRPHALPATDRDRLHADLLEFIDNREETS